MTRAFGCAAFLVAFVVACGEKNEDAAPPADASTPIPSAPDAGTWTRRASLAIPKQELAVVAVGDRVFVIGGLDGAARTLADVDAYDTKNDRWSPVAPLPEPLHHVNAAVVDGKIYVLGALRTAAFVATGIALVYDPAANAWSPRAAMPAGTERGSAFVAAIGTKIYVAGGLRGSSVADVSEYDVVGNAWTALPALPIARDHGMGAAHGGLFYAIGGRNAGISGHTARVDAFDPALRTWSVRAPMPTSRGGGAVAVAKGRIVVLSGEGDPRGSSGVFPEVEAYDPAADVWSALAPMQTPRHGTGAAAVGDVIIVPGGGTRQALGASDVVEALAF